MSQPKSKLQPAADMVFESGKTYTHAQGLSCCFRQWRATHSHCRYLHGYSLQVTVVFRAQELDSRNWVVDFGDLKWLKKYLEDTFDHKTLVAKDDPCLKYLDDLHNYGIIDMIEVDHVGCEAFAKMIYDHITHHAFFRDGASSMFTLEVVEVREHEGNFARYRRHS